MDPKALASLDPKLRETYEKVMGTSVNSTPTPKTSTFLPGLTKPQTQPVQTPPIPAPINSSLPNIPPPANPLTVPNNSTFPTPPANTQPMTTIQAPLETPGLVALQPTPTGIPLPTAQESPIQLGRRIQPLPSPASINKAVAPSSHSSPIIRVLYIVASIVFFAVYTVFWLKILKYPLPF